MARLFVGIVLLILLSGCGMLAGNSVAAPTPLPTFPPAPDVTPAAPAGQTVALGGKQVGEYFVWVYSSPNPPVRGGNNTFNAYVTDASGKPVNDARLTFDIDMTNMSHGKNVVEASATGGGYYSGKLTFMMPGPWRVNVGINRAGQVSSVRFDFMVSSK